MKARPTTLLFSEALARDPEARPLLEKLATLLEADGTGGLVGAPSPFVNGRGAGDIVGARATNAASARAQHETVVVVGHADVAARVGSARGVWLVHSLPLDLAEAAAQVPAFVDVVLPLAHPYEQSGSFTNLEGRVQGFVAAGTAPQGAKADWEALAALSRELGVTLPAPLPALREHLSSTHPLFRQVRESSTPRAKKRGLAVL